MDVQNLAELIRSTLHSLFASRLSIRLEEDLIRLRSDYETRLQERDRLIAEYRERIVSLEGKVDRYELVLIPLSSQAGSLLSPKPQRQPTFEANPEPRAMTWPEIQAEWDRTQAAEIEKEKRHGNDQGRQAQVEQV